MTKDTITQKEWNKIFDMLDELQEQKFYHLLITAIEEHCECPRAKVEFGLKALIILEHPNPNNHIQKRIRDMIEWLFGFCCYEKTIDNTKAHVEAVEKRFINLLDEDIIRKLGYVI